MAKKKKLTKHAFGLLQNEDGTWHLVKIGYDLDKGSVGDVTTIPVEDASYGMSQIQVEIENEYIREKEEHNE